MRKKFLTNLDLWGSAAVRGSIFPAGLAKSRSDF